MLWDSWAPKPVNQISLIADVTATDCSYSVLLCDKLIHIQLYSISIGFVPFGQFQLYLANTSSSKTYVSFCDHSSSVCDRLYGAVGLTVVRRLGLRPKDCP